MMITGINMMCNIIAGTAFTNAPVMNAAHENAASENVDIITRAIPHITRPNSMDIIRLTYMYGVFFGKSLYNIPDAMPYAASSNAIANPVGYIGGIPNSINLSNGATNPTIPP